MCVCAGPGRKLVLDKVLVQTLHLDSVQLRKFLLVKRRVHGHRSRIKKIKSATNSLFWEKDQKIKDIFQEQLKQKGTFC